MSTKIASLYAEIGADTKGLDKGLKSSKQGLAGLAKSAIGEFAAVGAAVAAAGFAVKKAFEFAEEGAQVARLETSFENMTRSVGANSDNMLKALQEASRGTIANTDLMLNANRAMMLGVTDNADELANLLEIASFRGRAMGLSTQQAFNDIVTGVGRASPLILDNLGIVTKGKDIYGEYAASIGKTADALTGAEEKAALLSFVLKEGNAQLEQAGGLADDAASSFERLDASWKNYTDSLKREGAALSNVAGFAADYLDAAQDISDEIPVWARLTGVLGSGYITVKTAIAAANDEAIKTPPIVDENSASFDRAKTSVGGYTMSLEETARAAEIANTSYAGLLSMTQSMQSSYDSFNARQENTQEQIDRVLVKINEATIKYGAFSDEVEALKEQYLDLNNTMSENVKDQERDTQRRILDRAKEILSIDGLSAEEEKYLVNQGLAMGVYSESVATKTLQVINDAQEVASAFQAESESVITSVGNITSALDVIDGRVVNVHINANYAGFEGMGAFGGFDYTGFQGPGPRTRGGAGETRNSVVVNVGSVSDFSNVDYLTQEIVRRLGQ